LEVRDLPSTFPVLNLAGSGPGSLRQAVPDANAQGGANQVTFDPGLSLTGSSLFRPYPRLHVRPRWTRLYFGGGNRLCPFWCLTDVISHSPNQVMDTLGDAGLMFFAAGFDHLKRVPQR
jgi:hypothetical protein